MLNVTDLTLAYGDRVLFKEVNLKFLPGNCYGLIGANGAGKSTFLKIISGDIDSTRGNISVAPGERIAMLRQDQFAFDEYTVLHTVILGHKRLYDVMIERDAIYAKPDFSEEDGIRAGDLEAEFADLNGYEAESEAAVLLKGLGIAEELHSKKMGDLESGFKVRVLLAQAMFGNPDILLLDEPTNNLDLQAISWLEDFLDRFSNTLIVVSHDRHFLNSICTHIADIDFSKIQLYVGNYDFWYQSSQLAMKQRQESSKKAVDRIAELQEFVRRFSANASKSRQATSRKKLIEKLTPDEMPTSARKFPYIDFKAERPCGKIILTVANINKKVEGEKIVTDFSLTLNNGDKIAFIGPNDLVKTTLFEILAGQIKPDSGTIEWGATIKPAYFPKESSAFFTNSDLNLIDWLRQYSVEQETTFVRGFLGRMLFSGEEALKKVNVLSGGERVRCMLSRMMLTGANVLIFDDPTNHLDLEAISSLNNSLIKYPEVILFSSHDHEFVSTIANRIIEITPTGFIDRAMPFEEYIVNPAVQKLRTALYHHQENLML